MSHKSNLWGKNREEREGERGERRRRKGRVRGERTGGEKRMTLHIAFLSACCLYNILLDTKTLTVAHLFPTAGHSPLIKKASAYRQTLWSGMPC